MSFPFLSIFFLFSPFLSWNPGDACVPLIYAHLEGAEQVTLDGVFHSVDKPNDWYGAEEVIDRWLPAVAQELRPSTASGGGAAISELFSGRFANLFK